jgi:hypothetical protein
VATLVRVSKWMTQREAAELLQVHPSLVPKMVRRGDLAPRKRRPSLSRKQVTELAAAREASKDLRATKPPPRRPIPPDEEHQWLLGPAAAAVLGCSVVALGARERRGRVPCTRSDGRRWYRLDHLELIVRAKAAQTQRRVSRVR